MVSSNAVWAEVTFKNCNCMAWSGKHLKAPHVLLLIVENPNLAKLWPWIAVTCSQLSILVIAPSIQILVLINNMSELLADWEVLKLGNLVKWVFNPFERVLTVFLPLIDVVAMGQDCVVHVTHCYFLRIGNLLDQLELVVLELQVHLAALGQSQHAWSAQFHFFDRFVSDFLIQIVLNDAVSWELTELTAEVELLIAKVKKRSWERAAGYLVNWSCLERNHGKAVDIIEVGADAELTVAVLAAAVDLAVFEFQYRVMETAIERWNLLFREWQLNLYYFVRVGFDLLWSQAELEFLVRAQTPDFTILRQNQWMIQTACYVHWFKAKVFELSWNQDWLLAGSKHTWRYMVLKTQLVLSVKSPAKSFKFWILKLT